MTQRATYHCFAIRKNSRSYGTCLNVTREQMEDSWEDLDSRI